MARKNAIGLDIGASSIKLVQLKESKRGVQLERLAMKPLPTEAIVEGSLMGQSAVVNTIRDLINTHKIKVKDTALSISGMSVIIKKISLPSMDADELEEQINWEAAQYIPYDVTEVHMDYQLLQRRPDQGQMDVLLVAAKRDMVDEYVHAVRTAGLNPVVVEVDCFSVQNAFEHAYGFNPGETIALIDVGATTVNMSIVSNGITMFTRDINMGGNLYTEEIRKQLGVSYDEAENLKVDQDPQDPAQADLRRIMERVSETLAGEIQRSLDFYLNNAAESQFNRLYLSGGASREPSLAGAIERRARVKVELADPFRNVQVDRKLFGEELLAEMRPISVVAFGLALRKALDK